MAESHSSKTSNDHLNYGSREEGFLSARISRDAYLIMTHSLLHPNSVGSAFKDRSSTSELHNNFFNLTDRPNLCGYLQMSNGQNKCQGNVVGNTLSFPFILSHVAFPMLKEKSPAELRLCRHTGAILASMIPRSNASTSKNHNRNLGPQSKLV